MAYLISSESVKRTPTRGHGLGFLKPRTHTQTGTDALGPGQGWGKAPGTHHVELRAFLNLYNIAHSESAVDKGKSGRDADTSRCLLLLCQQKSEGTQGRRGLFAFFSQDGPGIRIHVMD